MNGLLTISKKILWIFLITANMLYLNWTHAADSTNVPMVSNKLTPQKLQSNTSTLPTEVSTQVISYPNNSTPPTLSACPQGYAATQVTYTSPYGQGQAYYAQTVCTGYASYCSSSTLSCQCNFQGCPFYCLGLCNDNDKVTYCATTAVAWFPSNYILSSNSMDFNISRVVCTRIVTNWVPYTSQ